MTKNGSFPKVEYAYDALGQRIAKTYKPSAFEHTWKTSYYVRDAQGNTLAVYEHTQAIPALRGNPVANTNYAVTQTLTLKEYTLYGSSRLGVHEANVVLGTRQFTGKYASVLSTSPQLLTLMSGITPTTNGWSTITATCSTTVNGSTTTATVTFKRYGLARGQKKYELANHLGNVMAVISDRKVQDATAPGTYLSCVLSYSDYYAFGWEMPGRSSTVSATRYGFNGKENDGETGFQDYGMRQYDRRVGRFFAVDPLTKEYPWYTPYQFAGNKPIQAIDLDGAEERICIHYVVNGGAYTEIVDGVTLTRTVSTSAGPHTTQISRSEWEKTRLAMYQAYGQTESLFASGYSDYGSIGMLKEQGTLSIGTSNVGTVLQYDPSPVPREKVDWAITAKAIKVFNPIFPQPEPLVVGSGRGYVERSGNYASAVGYYKSGVGLAIAGAGAIGGTNGLVKLAAATTAANSLDDFTAAQEGSDGKTLVQRRFPEYGNTIKAGMNLVGVVGAAGDPANKLKSIDLLGNAIGGALDANSAGINFYNGAQQSVNSEKTSSE